MSVIIISEQQKCDYDNRYVLQQCILVMSELKEAAASNKKKSPLHRNKSSALETALTKLPLTSNAKKINRFYSHLGVCFFVLHGGLLKMSPRLLPDSYVVLPFAAIAAGGVSLPIPYVVYYAGCRPFVHWCTLVEALLPKIQRERDSASESCSYVPTKCT